MSLSFPLFIGKQIDDLKDWRADLLAGFQVALIALPLCLGIAIASGVPPIAGVVTAIVGGIVVSRFTGAHVTINGPAAGLIVVILDAVESLGHVDNAKGYQMALAATVCAGLLQIVFGLLKAGRLGVLFPSAAVHGMMAAIGMIVFLKQYPILLGTKASSSSMLGIVGETGEIVLRTNPVVAGLGGLGILTLIFLPRVAARVTRLIPAPLWAVALGVILGTWIHLERPDEYSFWGHHYKMGPQLYLNLPAHVFASLGRPDFSAFFTLEFFEAVITIALVASLETLLSASAVDKMDPLKRKTNLNQDLIAMGLGTTVSGLLGGLPMIAEIVRSTANVNSGARTSWSNFFHGAFLLIAILLFPTLLAKIPLASLAALLVFTGYRLAAPRNFIHVKHIGLDQLSIFVVTVVMVLATDLLIGIGAGVATKALLHLLRGVSPRDLLKARFDVTPVGDEMVRVEIHSALVFSNILPLFSALEKIKDKKQILIDIRQAPFVDHTAIERLHAFRTDLSTQGCRVTIDEHENHERLGHHTLASRRLKP
jgi:MFS superfamily sulfate permease-like transporter